MRVNLIESYDRIMAFVAKHLPSPFYLEGTMRIDIRDIIFREIAVNLLIHRDFSDRYPAKLIIYKNTILAENGNKPRIYGRITSKNNMPYPKNPTIAKFFKEIGYSDELGSGVRKITKYAKKYAGNDIELCDEPIFKLNWKINLFDDQDNGIASGIVSGIATATPTDIVSVENKVLAFCEKPKKTAEIMAFLGYTQKRHFLQNILEPLINKGLLHRIHPNTPNHPDQKYTTINTPPSSINHHRGNAITDTPTATLTDTPTATLTDIVSIENKVLAFCEEPKKTAEIMAYMGYTQKRHFLQNIIEPLLHKGLLTRTYPDNLNHPNQRYIAVDKII